MTYNPKWAAAASWAAAFANAELVSLAQGDTAVSSVVISNSTGLYIGARVRMALSGTTGTGAPFIGFYLLPKNSDGSYGDGRAASDVFTGAPSQTYYAGNIVLPPSLSSGTFVGNRELVCDLPNSDFLLALYNNSGNALGATGNSVDIDYPLINLNG